MMSLQCLSSRVLVMLAVVITCVRAFDYQIIVGRDEVTGLAGVGFAPSYTKTVDTGDHLTFRLIDGEHWVVESLFDSPCVASGQFTSPRTTVEDDTAEDRGPWFTYTVTNASAALYFSDIGNNGVNCYQGAVFCANTNESSNKSCDAFKAAALAQGKARDIPTSVRTAPPLTSTATASSTATANPNALNRQNVGSSLSFSSALALCPLFLVVLMSQ